MKRTRGAVLALIAVIAAVLGYGTDLLLTSFGRPTFTPDWVLSVAQVIIAIAVLVLAWPIRRATHGGARVDPFRALRVAVLAKASSVLGSAIGGFALGLAVFLLLRPVPPRVGSITVIAVTVGTGVLLVIAALVAESFCTLPKDDDDNAPGSDEPAAPAHP